MRHTKRVEKKTALPIGPVLRELRKKSGLNQTELSKKTGIDSRTIAAIENGRIQTPSLPNLKKITAVLNCSLKDFFGRTEAESAEKLHVGTQRGEFSLDYPKSRFRILSYLPQTSPFFTGKLIVESKGRMDSSALSFPGMVFLQIVLGKMNFVLEGKEVFLKEGHHLYFDGRLDYALSNPLLRETTALLVASPSFVLAGNA